MATNQFLVLDKISMEYHTFRKDQLLTHTQLNELIDYFEDQDRLTRTCLVGVGLVCGLGITFDSKLPSVTVGKGCGVTTDGDLLTMDATTFKNFKIYDNRKKGTTDPIYDPFFPATDGGKQMDLWELVIPDSKGVLPLDSKPLGTFNAVTGKVLDDMTALLYLEYYLQDPDKCTAIDCDNQGPRQVAQIKVLLLSKVDMEQVINRDPAAEIIADSIYTKYHKSGAQYFNLPVLKAKRVILNATNTSSIALLAKSYTGIVQTEAGKLINAVADLYDGFKFMIDPANAVNINSLKTDLQLVLSAVPKIYHAQYVYDFYKDLLAAYNELRELLFKCMSECCPDKYAFPKHIMLGELKPTGAKPAQYRHEFYPSPAVSGYRDKIAQSKSMWQRLLSLIHQFNLLDQPSVVKITPSTDYDRLLEDRAVPFYFKDLTSIVANWNFSLSRRGAEKNVLSYHAGQYAAGLDSTLNPLDYSIDGNNFFRIEGHLGKQLSEAMSLIANIKNDKSVPFDVVAIRVNKAGNLADVNINDFDCQFEDLTAILKAWLIEQNCLYANITRFFSGFSTNKAVGFHTQIDTYRAVAQPMLLVKRNITLDKAAASQVAGIKVLAQSATVSTQTAASPALPFCKTVYTVDKTIVANLETASSSLGISFAETMKQPALSADDIVADMKRRTASDPNLASISPDEKETVYEVPINLVANVSQISQLKPLSVDEISTTLLEEYMKRMEQLCAYVKKLRSRMENIFSAATYTRNGFESYYLILIEELIANCCAAEKLESLLDEINKRKQKILDSLLFSNYASQHPGLEHKAGVHRGGTFVLVYAQQSTATRLSGLNLLTDATAVTNAASSSRLAIANKETAANADSIVTTEKVLRTNLSVYEDLDSFAYYLVTNQGKVNFDTEVAKYQKLHNIKDGSLEDQLFNRQLSAKIKEVCARLTKEEEATVAANVVVADFTLPYLCCSDCPPMVFMMPKQTFSLSLPKATACSDEPLLQFRKEPVDGVVKAQAGFEATIVNKDGNTFFDATKVPVASFGAEISFTINDQVTDCRITVFKHPVAGIDFKPQSENDDAIQVIFSNTSDDATGTQYVYEWDFGDGRTPVKTDNKASITILYKKATLQQLNITGTIPVKLTATNSSCSNTVTVNVPFKPVVPVSLSLPKDIVCNDNAQLKFTVSPADGVVASVEEPTSVVKVNSDLFFDPKQVKNFGKVINFTVNGKATTCHITVYQHPKAAFDFAATSTPGANNQMLVTFTNLTDPQNSQQLNYTWTFGDGTSKVTTDTKPFQQLFNIDVLRSKNQAALIVSLAATNPGCNDKVERSIPFPVTNINCGDIVKTAISADSDSLNTAAIKAFLASMQTSPQFTLMTSQLTDTNKIFSTALSQAGTLDQATVQLSLMTSIRNQLQKLYADKFDKATNDAIVTPQILALLKLTMNIIKCSATIDGKVNELFNAIFAEFNNASAALKQVVSGLNKGNVLINFVNDYLSTTKLTDAAIISVIKKFAENVKATFLP